MQILWESLSPIFSFFDSIWTLVGFGLIALWSIVIPMIPRLPLLIVSNGANFGRRILEQKLLVGANEEQRLPSLNVPNNQKDMEDWLSRLARRHELYSTSLENMKPPLHGPYAFNWRCASFLRGGFEPNLRITKGDLAVLSDRVGDYMTLVTAFKEEQEHDQKTFRPNMQIINRCSSHIDDLQYQLKTLFWTRKNLISWKDYQESRAISKKLRKRLNLLIRYIRNRRKAYQKRERQIFRTYERELRKLAFKIMQADEQTLRQPIHALRANFGQLHSMVTSGDVVNRIVDPKDKKAVELRAALMFPNDFPWDIEAAKTYMLKSLDGRAALSPTPAREDILECWLRKHLLEDVKGVMPGAPEFSAHYLNELCLPGAMGLARQVYGAQADPSHPWLKPRRTPRKRVKPQEVTD